MLNIVFVALALVRYLNTFKYQSETFFSKNFYLTSEETNLGEEWNVREDI